MSTQVRVQNVVCCDWPECGAQFVGDEGMPVAEVRKQAIELGWRHPTQRPYRPSPEIPGYAPRGWVPPEPNPHIDLCPTHVKARRAEQTAGLRAVRAAAKG